MSITTLCDEIAEKIVAVKQKGFADGEKAEHDAFWDAFQNYGQRTSYLMAFANTTWNDGNFYPKHDIKPAGSILNMFYYSAMTNVAQRLTECGVTLDMSNAANLTEAFASAQTSTVPPLDLKKATVMTRCFQNAKKLTQAPLKNVSGVTAWANAFNGCTALTDIGQESDDFGYFSTSVDLSQTAINFGTDKMALIGVLGHLVNGEAFDQSRCFLKKSPSTTQTLTISASQHAMAVKHISDVTDGAITSYESFVTWLGWTLIVV